MKTIHIVQQPQQPFRLGSARQRVWRLLQAFDGLSVASFVKACRTLESASGVGGDPGGWVKFFTAEGRYDNRPGNPYASQKLAEVRTRSHRANSVQKKPRTSTGARKPKKLSKKAAIRLREENIRRTAVLAGDDPTTAIDRARGLFGHGDGSGVPKKRPKIKLRGKKRKQGSIKKGAVKRIDAMSRRVSGSFESGKR